MQKLAGLLACIFLSGCAIAPTSDPPPPHPPPPPAAPPPLLIGTPRNAVKTPALQTLMKGTADEQMLVQFLVKADGQVEHPAALFTGLSPADTATALQAFRQWRFKPALDGQQPVSQRFIYPLFFGPDAPQERTRFFCRNQAEVYAPDSKCEIVTFGKWRIYRMDPVYPPHLLKRRLAGTVTLSFNIGKRGQALNPKVVSANPPTLFNTAALAAVKQWYFEPLQEAKKGVKKGASTEHVTVTVKFTPPATPAAGGASLSRPARAVLHYASGLG